MLTAKFPYFIRGAYGLCLCIYDPFCFSLYIPYEQHTDVCIFIYVRHHHVNKQASQPTTKARQPKKHIVNICQIKAENPSNIFHKNPTHSERRMDDFLLILLFEGFFFLMVGLLFLLLYYFYCEARIIFG